MGKEKSDVVIHKAMDHFANARDDLRGPMFFRDDNIRYGWYKRSDHPQGHSLVVIKGF